MNLSYSFFVVTSSSGGKCDAKIWTNIRKVTFFKACPNCKNCAMIMIVTYRVKLIQN